MRNMGVQAGEPLIKKVQIWEHVSDVLNQKYEPNVKAEKWGVAAVKK